MKADSHDLLLASPSTRVAKMCCSAQNGYHVSLGQDMDDHHFAWPLYPWSALAREMTKRSVGNSGYCPYKATVVLWCCCYITCFIGQIGMPPRDGHHSL
jgi:hypothetical protein